MGEKESDKPAQVNLEMPSFGLRRKKKARDEAEDPAAAEPVAPVVDQAPEAPAPEVEPEVVPEVSAPAEVAPVAEAAPPPAPVAAPEPEPAPTSRFAPPAVPAAATPAVPAAATPAPERVREPVREPAAAQLADDLEPENAEEAPAKKQLKVQLPEFKAPRLPVIPTMTASAITGVVIGLLACLGTYLGLNGCEAIKKTDSCGGPGLLLVLAILAIMVVAGTYLLKLFAVRDAGSVSFMAVGMLSMLVLAILIPWIFEWFMLIVVPLLGAGCYMLAHFVVALFDED